LSAILALLLKPQVLGGLAVGLLVLFAGVQTARISSLKSDLIDPATKQQWSAEEKRDSTALKVANINLATCTQNTDTLTASLDRQNAAVAALQAQSLSATARANKAAQQALIATENASKLARQVLQPSADHSCQAAEALINRSLP